jgi:release factor glutamine methyltransferase
MTKIEIGAWLAQARMRLIATSENPGLEAQALLANALQRPRTWLVAHPEAEIPTHLLDRLDQKLEALDQGTPLAYLTGQQEFDGRVFYVSPAVLIPRPETELLVEEALNFLRPRSGLQCIADAGTGSGCIAISLALGHPQSCVLATDISVTALQVARSNAVLLKAIPRVAFLQADLLAPLKTHFDLITANLPYIPSVKLAALPVSRYEPSLALDGGPDGLHLITRLLEQARQLLTPDGLVLCEIEAGQSKQAIDLAHKFFSSALIQVLPDLAGLPRLLRIEKQPS